MKRIVFFVSDRTGITVETLGHSLLTQFENVQFSQFNLPFIDTLEKAERAVEQINAASSAGESRPIVFSTLVRPDIRAVVARCEGIFLDFFDAFVLPLEKELEMESSHTMGRTHGLVDSSTYNVRMDAVNFSLANDDGVATNSYPQSDIVVIGVSRTGKTPTCLYLALQFGIRAANFPLTEEDLDGMRLPPLLHPFRSKIYGLTIDAQRLHHIRQERRPDSRYASLKQCTYEVRQIEALYRIERIPFLNATTMSIEEIATTILRDTGLKRRLF
jgi:regulator of PEP synthase PpsR (kinase-PPPase family)